MRKRNIRERSSPSACLEKQASKSKPRRSADRSIFPKNSLETDGLPFQRPFKGYSPFRLLVMPKYARERRDTEDIRARNRRCQGRQRGDTAVGLKF